MAGWAPRKFKGAKIDGVLVYGPPCAGKNYYVQERFLRGDMIIDVDALNMAITGVPTHDRFGDLFSFALDAREALIDRLARKGHNKKVYVIATAPTEYDRNKLSRRLGLKVVLLNPGKEICLARARKNRPKEWPGYIEAWYRDFKE